MRLSRPILAAVACLCGGVAQAQSIVVDHSCINLSAIPESAIENAKQQLRVLYAHASHGSQISKGMNGLQRWKGQPYVWSNEGGSGALEMRDFNQNFRAPDNTVVANLGSPQWNAWVDATDAYLAAHPEINVVMWSWCGEVSGARADKIAEYLTNMTALETKYPNVKFVYMTGHLDGTGLEGNLHQRNEQIREYCRANGKILYDFADIESYDPDGNYYGDRHPTDGCNYDFDGNGVTTEEPLHQGALPIEPDRNWAIDWQARHERYDWIHGGNEETADYYGYYGPVGSEGVDNDNIRVSHSQPINYNMKAYAAWWLWARLAGWSGPSNDATPPTAPSALQGTAQSSTSISLTWNAANDPESGVQSYVIYRDGSRVGSTASTSFVDSQLSADTAYAYAVSALNGASLEGSRSASVTLRTPPGSGTAFEVRVSLGSDDAEESPSGTVNLSSSDLELVRDGPTALQTVGVRFSGVRLPRGANISEAYLQFQVDETTSEATTLQIRGEASESPLSFTAAANNISARPLTAAVVDWSPGPWGAVGEAGAAQCTGNLAAVIQELVNREGWASGNAMAFILRGTGVRIAQAYEGNPSGAALLHVEYVERDTLPPVLLSAEAATATSVRAVFSEEVERASAETPSHYSIAGATVLAAALGEDQRTVTLTTSSLVGGREYTLSATDIRDLAMNLGSSQRTFAYAAAQGSIDVQIAAGGDDAEQSPSGAVNLSSSDLELVRDGPTALQVVGLRFPGIQIPRGATVRAASIQFAVDEVTTEATTLRIVGQAADTAHPFTASTNDISSRASTTAFALWSPAPWNTVGEAGLAQRTTDLSAIVQEVVDREGWSSGNALAFVVTGTGLRIARAYEGNPSGAALLHVEFDDEGDTTPPAIVSATAMDARTIRVVFDEAVDPTSAAAASHYAITEAAVNTATLEMDGCTVTLTTSELTAGREYTVTATGIRDLALNSGSSLGSFVYSAQESSIEVRIALGSDDAEEVPSSVVFLDSSDLELVRDGPTALQVVGLRFPGVPIPRGATITAAAIQFQVDETGSEPTALRIHAQADDSAPPFTTARGSISARASTATYVDWAPEPWVAVGDAGAAQQTPDLARVIQEVVDRAGWVSGNALVFTVRGTGLRVAESYDGLASGAPLLRVRFRQ